jgi:tetratricopeptide (TPR) repeat protein
MAKTIKAFVAKSFAPADEARIQPLLDFLDTFSPLGVIFESADHAESEEVSTKVKRMIDDASIFVAIFTKKYPICEIKQDNSLCQSSPPKWTPPLWLLQETGYALAKEKRLVFFVETGVEIPRLAGDHEYIEYDSERPSEAYKRASQMFSRLISGQLSLVLETALVQETQAPATPDQSQSPPKPAKEEPPKSEDLTGFIRRVFDCLEQGDLQMAKKAADDGLEYVRANEPEREVTWQTFCLNGRIDNGDAAALNELKKLATAHPESSMPLSALGRAYAGFGNHRQASEYFKSALEVANIEERAWLVASRARSLSDLGEHSEAVSFIKAELHRASDADRSYLLERLYDILKAKGDGNEAFSVGEFCLAENGALAEFHFKLAYDYDESKFKELSIYHYTSLLQLKAEHPNALNNLGAIYRRLELPIVATRAQKQAVELGETLPAANLGYAYLNEGFIDDAQAVLAPAMSKPDHHENVTHALAEIESRKRAESDKLDDLLENAKKQRGFLQLMGDAILDTDAPREINGDWTFPVGEINLVQGSPESVVGKGEKTIKGGGVASILGGSPVADTVEKFTFNAQATGRLLKFRLEVETRITGSYYPSTDTKSGYLVLDKDGNGASAMAIEPNVEFFQVRRNPQLDLALSRPT